MKFRESFEYYYDYTPGDKEIICYTKEGKELERIDISIMFKHLLDYCSIIQKFPWEK